MPPFPCHHVVTEPYEASVHSRVDVLLATFALDNETYSCDSRTITSKYYMPILPKSAVGNNEVMGSFEGYRSTLIGVEQRS